MRKVLLFVGLLAALMLALMVPVLAAPAAATACPGAPAPRLTVGAVARPAQVFSSLRQALNSDVVLTVMYKTKGDTFIVLQGPACGTGPHNWYQVNYKGTVGWVTEGMGSTYWVEPVTPSPTPAPVTPAPTATPKPPVTPTPSTGACAGAPAPRLIIGSNARPAQVFSSLRAALDSNDVLTVMYRAKNDVFKVLAGPFCGTGPHNWWQVDFKGKVGWVTEGMGSTYWVEPAPTPK